jgi:DNA-binding IclR family transcriptional regulator
MAGVTIAGIGSPSRTTGSQTLARGLEALKAIAGSRDGLTIQDVAAILGVHRTVAYRLLNTLEDAALVRRGDDNRYRGASGLVALARAAHASLRAAALPVLGQVANELGSTVSLLVREGQDAVALAVVEPQNTGYRVSFAEGSRHPLDRGAAGHAILASYPPDPSDSEDVRRTRDSGYSITFGEVEPGMFGLAAPLRGTSTDAPACLNLITTRRELAESAGPEIIAAAARISARLA